jgi:hypothetical protein
MSLTHLPQSSSFHTASEESPIIIGTDPITTACCLVVVMAVAVVHVIVVARSVVRDDVPKCRRVFVKAERLL